MVYKRNELKSLIDDFVKGLEKEISIEKVIIFGSYAWGRPNRYSDIDIAVISSDFDKFDDLRRIELLLDIVYQVKMPKLVDIELLGFTPKELKDADCFDIACEIRERGKIVYPADKR